MSEQPSQTVRQCNAQYKSLLTITEVVTHYRVYVWNNEEKREFEFELSPDVSVGLLLERVLDHYRGAEGQVYLSKKNGQPKLDFPSFETRQSLEKTGQNIFAIVLQFRYCNSITSRPRVLSSHSQVQPRRRFWSILLCCQQWTPLLDFEFTNQSIRKLRCVSIIQDAHFVERYFLALPTHSVLHIVDLAVVIEDEMLDHEDYLHYHRNHDETEYQYVHRPLQYFRFSLAITSIIIPCASSSNNIQRNHITSPTKSRTIYIMLHPLVLLR